MEKRVLHSLFDLKFDSRLFIEASAGTGKTYTIVGLFLRLLIEKGLKVDQILVMTFTKKATAELRERIFARLRETVHYLQTGEAEDRKFMSGLESAIAGLDRNQLIHHLTDSIRNFDESQIYTIHSFCQKILREEALMAGTPFEVEITQQDDLLLESAEDEWRLFMAEYQSNEPGRYYIRKLMDLAGTPAELVKELAPLFNRSYAEREGVGHPEPLSYLKQVIELRRELTSCWNEERNEIESILEKCKVSRFQQHLDSRIRKLIRFLEDDLYMIDAPDDDILKYFRADYLYDEDKLLKKFKHEKTEEHRFFELCERYHDLVSDMGRVETGLIEHFYKAIYARRERLSADSKSLTYDDLLNRVSATLSDPDHGKELASVILKKVPYALVDEFQDTDPVQYRIFDTIYPETGDESGLLMIGDPKQAIYAFRGADIYTYLRAREQCKGEAYSLLKNYRSSRELIEAVNSLFIGEHDPFLEKKIPFTRSETGEEKHSGGLLIRGEPPTALQISLNSEFFKNKSDALSFSVGETVQQIVNLLNLSKEGRATIEDKELKAADICVLVNSHRDAAAVKRALKNAGVGAVTYSRDKVFESFEAARLNLALLAILEPQNTRQVNAALLNGFFGLSLSSINQLRNDESEFQAVVEELQELNMIWHRSGFYPMFRALLYRKERLANLAELEFSERVLTNLLQLADICSKAEAEGKLSPRALHSWFQRQMTDPDQDDEKTLLLESDQNLVKISTIHSSKGLQFPIVFIPTPWTGLSSSGKKSLFEIYNDRDRDQTVINIDQSGSPERIEAAQRSKFESLADEVRKFYVAVTRAKYHCMICWATHSNSHFSGLGAAMLGRETIWDLVQESKNTISEKSDLNHDTFIEEFSRLAKKNADLIGLELKSEEDSGKKAFRFDAESVGTYRLRVYNGRKEIPVQKRLESFSSLVHHKSEPGEPDYDQIVQSYADIVSSEPNAYNDPAKVEDRTIFSFPRGATAGSAIHKVFEHEQFDFRNAGRAEDEEWTEDGGRAEHEEFDFRNAGRAEDEGLSEDAGRADHEEFDFRKKGRAEEVGRTEDAGRPEYEEFDFRKTGRAEDKEWARDEEWIGEVLSQFRIDPEWAPVVRKMLYDASGALIPGLRLDQVGEEDQLREMEFHFGSKSVRAEELFEVIRNRRAGRVGGAMNEKGTMAGRVGENREEMGAGGDRDDENVDRKGTVSDREGENVDGRGVVADRVDENLDVRSVMSDRIGENGDGKGFMTGFIDLIVRQNGKYYILDYKSNHLGDSESDYVASALQREMQKAGYDLQAHIYMVALVKYLKERIPDFSYEKHIGGAVYLFVRGVKHGSGNGVWFQKPDEQVVRNLEQILSRG